LRTIRLTKNKKAKVDDEDYEWLSQYKWYACEMRNKWYAVRKVNRKNVYMHRFIISPDIRLQIDHIDGDGLNNTRENLRVCTSTENARNRRKINGGSSQYKGVHWHKRQCQWIARITIDRKQIQIGSFNSEIEAAKAYDDKARYYFGEFAKLNF